MNTLFVCKFTITYGGREAEDPVVDQHFRRIYNQLVICARLWFAEMYSDYSLKHPEELYGFRNSHLRTDYVYLYRYICNVSTPPAVSKLCEGFAAVLSLYDDFFVSVSYREELPELCPPPYIPTEDEYQAAQFLE